GPVQTVTADHHNGEKQAFEYYIPYNKNYNDLSIVYLNDAFDIKSGGDRNLYLNDYKLNNNFIDNSFYFGLGGGYDLFKIRLNNSNELSSQSENALAGTATPNTQITLKFIQNNILIKTINTYSDNNGNWRINSDGIDNGYYDIYINSEDEYGIKSKLTNFNIVVNDNNNTQPTLSKFIKNEYDGTAYLEGSSSPNSIVNIYSYVFGNKIYLGNVNASESGYWNIHLSHIYGKYNNIIINSVGLNSIISKDLLVGSINYNYSLSSSSKIYVGGNVPLIDYADKYKDIYNNTSIYLQEDQVIKENYNGDLSKIYSLIDNKTYSFAEINEKPASYAKGWFDSNWNQFFNSRNIITNKINMIIDFNQQNWFVDFLENVSAARDYGVICVSPIFSPNGISDIGSFLNDSSYINIKNAALIGGGITIDSPPNYFFSQSKVYQDFILDEIGWANKNNILVSLILSPYGDEN
uniref:carbohydrate-binding domain-containing protein n=3 Tax=Neokomagataea TaxID=1223423 RepID=UPI002265A060